MVWMTRGRLACGAPSKFVIVKTRGHSDRSVLWTHFAQSKNLFVVGTSQPVPSRMLL
jgi:hypothetical protein